MRSIFTKCVIAAVAALFVVAGAVSTADAGRGGRGGGHMGGFKGGHMGSFKGMHWGGGKAFRYGGGAKAFHYGGGKFKGGKHYAYGGKWHGKYGHFKHYGHYRRYGYPWWGLPLYTYTYSGGCGWLYRRAVATGSEYWWNRYNQCVGNYY